MKYIKSTVSLLLSLIVIAGVFSFNVSAEKEVAISSYSDLLNIANDLNGKYYLTKDIEITNKDKALKPIGTAVKQFKGTLDGRNHSIKGLRLEAEIFGATKIAGIFSYNGGNIKNLKIEDVSVSCGNSNYSYAGAVAGVNLGTIDNCLVSGNIANKGIKVAQYTGGICGQMLSGSITSCVSYANLYCEGGEIYSGGICGYTERGKVSSSASYSSMFLNAASDDHNIYSGGIIGYARKGSEIADCLFSGGIISENCNNSYAGGIAGVVAGNVNRTISLGTITNSDVFSHIYVGSVAGDDLSATVADAYYLEGTFADKITGKTGTVLSKKSIGNASSYSNFDFHNLWALKDGVPYIKVLLSPSQKNISALTGIKIKTKPKKFNYDLGDTRLDLEGIKVYAIYSDKETLLMQNDYSFGGFNTSSAGIKTITVIYKGFKDYFDITVSNKPSASSDSSSNINYIDGNSSNPKIPNIIVDPGKGVTEANDSSNKGNTKSKSDGTESSKGTASGSLDALEDYGGVSSNSAAGEKIFSPAVWILIFAAAVAAAAIITILFIKQKKGSFKTKNNELNTENDNGSDN